MWLQNPTQITYQIRSQEVHDEGDVLAARAEVVDLRKALGYAQGLVETVLKEQHWDLGIGRLQLDGELRVGVNVPG